MKIKKITFDILYCKSFAIKSVFNLTMDGYNRGRLIDSYWESLSNLSRILQLVFRLPDGDVLQAVRARETALMRALTPQIFITLILWQDLISRFLSALESMSFVHN